MNKLANDAEKKNMQAHEPLQILDLHMAAFPIISKSLVDVFLYLCSESRLCQPRSSRTRMARVFIAIKGSERERSNKNVDSKFKEMRTFQSDLKGANDLTNLRHGHQSRGKWYGIT